VLAAMTIVALLTSAATVSLGMTVTALILVAISFAAAALGASAMRG